MFIDTAKKYRPQTLDEFIYPNDEARELITAYATGEIVKPLILHGTSGTGKSLIQQLLPNAIENTEAVVQKVLCDNLKKAGDVHKHYGANKQFDSVYRDNTRYNYVIIEEFMISNQRISDAFKIEIDKRMGVDLTIISTNRFDKIDAGIRSRSEVLELVPCEPHIFFPHAKKIFEIEGVSVEDQVLMDCLDVTYKLHKDNRKYYSALDKKFRIACATQLGVLPTGRKFL